MSQDKEPGVSRTETQTERLVKELETSLKYFKATLAVFEEEDSGFAPQPDLYSVSGHVAHTADSVEWFVEGAFGKGWNMDFEGLIAAARAVTSLSDAVGWLDRAYATAAEAVGSASDEALSAPIPDRRIMAGAPRAAIVGAIADHSAHHRGSLAVYARLLGKTPAMPYQ